MPHLPVILRLLQLRVRGSRDCRSSRHLVVVLEGRDRHKRQEMIRISPPLLQEMRRHRRAGEQVVGGRVRGATTTGTAAGTAANPAGKPLHPLEVKAVFLEVAGDVFTGQSVDAHELHYGLRDGVLDAEVGDGVDEALVELRRPDEAWTLEGPGGLVAAVARSELAGVGDLARGGWLLLGGGV